MTEHHKPAELENGQVVVIAGTPSVGIAADHCVQFKSTVKDLNDPNRPLMAARCAGNMVVAGGGIALTRIVSNQSGNNSALRYDATGLPTSGVNDWPSKAKAIGAFPNLPNGIDTYSAYYRTIEMSMHPVIDGDYYEIPNMFYGVVVMSNVCTNFYFVSNLADRQSFTVSADPQQLPGIYIYGYKHGDRNQPYILLMTSKYAQGEEAMYWLDIKVIKRVDYENPEDTFALFNLKFSELMRDDPSFNPRQLIVKDPKGVDAPIIVPTFATWSDAPATFTAIKLEPNGQTTKVSASPEYMNVTSIVNDTDQTMTFKTPDYALKVTDTAQYQWSNNEKGTLTISGTYKNSLKVSAKGKVGANEAGIEDTTEWSVTATASFEYSHTSQNTNTHTNEQTYTVGGQTFQIPPRSAYNLVASFVRASVKGTMKVYYPVDIKPQLKVIHRWYDRADPLVLNGQMDVNAVQKLMKLPAFVDVTVKNLKGEDESVPCVWGEMPFEASNSSICSVTLKYVGPVEPKK